VLSFLRYGIIIACMEPVRNPKLSHGAPGRRHVSKCRAFSRTPLAGFKTEGLWGNGNVIRGVCPGGQELTTRI